MIGALRTYHSLSWIVLFRQDASPSLLRDMFPLKDSDIQFRYTVASAAFIAHKPYLDANYGCCHTRGLGLDLGADDLKVQFI